jgi:A/G-specific adenine glycosylase
MTSSASYAKSACSILNPHERRYFRQKLLKWYSCNHRFFPWRSRVNSFHLLIAEVLLQQTDAAKVALIYPRFIEVFPTPSILAMADEMDVDRLISCIGLRYRASRLIKAATIIQNKFGGLIPAHPDALLSLPGIGPYVTSAVLASAFHQRRAVLDTNVIRILSRFFGLRSSRLRPHTDPYLWHAAQELLPRRSRMARTWNYAMLDFSALICRHRNPSCNECPCRRLCRFLVI